MSRTDIGEPQANDRASLFTHTHWSQGYIRVRRLAGRPETAPEAGTD